MSSPLHPQLFVTARSSRLSALNEIENIMKKIMMNEDMFKQMLVRAAQDVVDPRVLKFLEEEGTVDTLFKYGQSSQKIVYGRAYGFQDSGAVKKAFMGLKNAWNNAINITFSDGEPHRIGITFTIP
jgi:hypothetical protein